MDRAAILRRTDEERRYLARDGEIITVLPNVTRLNIESAYMVAYSSLTATDADAAIAGEIAHHRQLGVSFEWKLYSHDQPADLIQRLQQHGLIPGPREAVLVYDLANAPNWASERADCTVARIERQEQIADYRRVAEAVFDKNYAYTAGQLSVALAAGSTQHCGYIAYVGEEPVTIGRLYTHPDSHFAGLYGGGTLPGFRGRGCYRALVAARARDAIALGARHLIVDALPTSRPILEQLGFHWIADTWPCEWLHSGG